MEICKQEGAIGRMESKVESLGDGLIDIKVLLAETHAAVLQMAAQGARIDNLEQRDIERKQEVDTLFKEIRKLSVRDTDAAIWKKEVDLFMDGHKQQEEDSKKLSIPVKVVLISSLIISIFGALFWILDRADYSQRPPMSRGK